MRIPGTPAARRSRLSGQLIPYFVKGGEEDAIANNFSFSNAGISVENSFLRKRYDQDSPCSEKFNQIIFSAPEIPKKF